MGSINQRASKLPAFKVGGLMKKSAIRPRPHLNQSARVRTRAKSNHSQSLMAGNFAALWSADLKFSALKDLNPFNTVPKVQEASIVLRVGFSLSKWPHFNSIYLVRVPFLTGIAVYLSSQLGLFDDVYSKILWKYILQWKVYIELHLPHFEIPTTMFMLLLNISFSKNCILIATVIRKGYVITFNKS